jgi:hypothetical protein
MDTIKRARKRATPRSKKTIRKMTPLARKLAHLTRAMQSNLKRLACLTEALYELERSENAAQAQIQGHAMVCPLAKEPLPPAPELWPELPNGEGILTASEIEQGREPPDGCEVDGPGDGHGL